MLTMDSVTVGWYIETILKLVSHVCLLTFRGFTVTLIMRKFFFSSLFKQCCHHSHKRK